MLRVDTPPYIAVRTSPPLPTAAQVRTADAVIKSFFGRHVFPPCNHVTFWSTCFPFAKAPQAVNAERQEVPDVQESYGPTTHGQPQLLTGKPRLDTRYGVGAATIVCFFLAGFFT